jgi:hypothetical protein
LTDDHDKTMLDAGCRDSRPTRIGEATHLVFTTSN